jgi:hypothetical protein
MYAYLSEYVATLKTEEDGSVLLGQCLNKQLSQLGAVPALEDDGAVGREGAAAPPTRPPKTSPQNRSVRILIPSQLSNAGRTSR